MADTIFSNWLTALQNLQSSVSKDLSEIRKQKAEIQQLKADILNEVARGKFIRDNERLVLSAPEIVIGNVDASGMLYGDAGTIIIRGQKLGLEGVGENGRVETRAALIAQTAVDPGPDGIEEVVRSKSAIINQAKHITLQSNEAGEDGYFSRSATTTGATGVRIHADEEVEIDASQSVEHRKEAIENRLIEVKQQAFDLSSKGITTMASITGTVAAMEAMLQGQDLLNFDEYLMRVTVTILDSLTQVFKNQLPMAYDALENAISTMTKLAEVNRRQKALEAEKKLVEDATEHFKEVATGAHLSVTAEQMSIASKDGDDNIRENSAASISVQTGKLNITSYKKDGSLIDDSSVRIATHDVEISTVNPQLKEEDKTDGDYTTEGSVQINSKNVSVAAVDYSINDGKYEEKEQTKESRFSVRTENVSMLSYDTEGNTTGSWYVAAEQMAQGSFEFVPRDMEMLPFIQKGIAEAHPEFKQEVIKPEGEDHFFYPNTPEYDQERHIVCTMPEVDDNRYDTLKEAVKTLYDERMVEIDKVKADYTKQLSDRSGDLPKDETDEAMNKLEELANQYSETCKTYRDNKEQEIEESHQKWLVNQAEERLNRLHGNKE